MKTPAVLVAVILAESVAMTAQQNDTPKPRKLVKTLNYQMMVAATGGTFSLRSGARVPVVEAKGTTYIDVGVNLDVKNLQVTKDGLEFDVVLEASGALDAGAAAPLTKQPIIYQTRWNSRVGIALGKLTSIFSSDAPSSKHQLQLEVTASQVH